MCDNERAARIVRDFQQYLGVRPYRPSLVVDFWAAALLIAKRYGDDAMLEAAETGLCCRCRQPRPGRHSRLPSIR
jgi:hypothetical protein